MEVSGTKVRFGLIPKAPERDASGERPGQVSSQPAEPPASRGQTGLAALAAQLKGLLLQRGSSNN